MTNKQAELVERFHRYVAVSSQSLPNDGKVIEDARSYQ